MCSRRSQHRLAGAMGDRGVQTAAAVAERSALQAHLGHLDRLQEHCLQDSQRVETVTASAGPRRLGRGDGAGRGRGGVVRGVDIVGTTATPPTSANAPSSQPQAFQMSFSPAPLCKIQGIIMKIKSYIMLFGFSNVAFSFNHTLLNFTYNSLCGSAKPRADSPPTTTPPSLSVRAASAVYLILGPDPRRSSSIASPPPTPPDTPTEHHPVAYLFFPHLNARARFFLLFALSVRLFLLCKEFKRSFAWNVWIYFSGSLVKLGHQWFPIEFIFG